MIENEIERRWDELDKQFKNLGIERTTEYKEIEKLFGNPKNITYLGLDIVPAKTIGAYCQLWYNYWFQNGCYLKPEGQW